MVSTRERMGENTTGQTGQAVKGKKSRKQDPDDLKAGIWLFSLTYCPHPLPWHLKKLEPPP
jgi:hypothetical protein